jgi:hypothetical protein
MISDFNLKKRSLQMKKGNFVNKMESIVGPSWKGGNIQVAEVILDTFEPLFGQFTNDVEFVNFLIKSLQMIKQEMLEKI